MATRYWVGGSGTWNSSDTTHWSASSGGAGGASVPTGADNVIFDSLTTYTVTCYSGTCANMTVSGGTVTFSVLTSNTYYFISYGNTISITAATVFSAPANVPGLIGHYPSSAAPASVSFGSSGANTQKIAFARLGGSETAYTFCNAQTQTFHSFYYSGTGFNTFTCAGSTITIDQQDRVSANQTDSFYISGVTNLSVAGTTLNLGTATAVGSNPQCSVQIYCTPTAGTEPNLSTFNITQVRAYASTAITASWYNTATAGLQIGDAPFKFGNLTFKGIGKTSSSGSVSLYGCNALTATDTSLNMVHNYQDLTIPFVISGTTTLNGSNLVWGYSSANATFGYTKAYNFAAVTLTTGTVTTGGSTLDFLTAGSSATTINFSGAVSLTGSASQDASNIYFARNPTVTFLSTLTSSTPANPTNFNAIFAILYNGGGGSITCSGNVSLTNTDVGNYDLGWVCLTTATLTVTTNPTTRVAVFYAYYIQMATGAASFTSCDVFLYGGNASNYAFQSSAGLTVNGSGTASGVTFNAYTLGVSFATGATLTTWTDVYIGISSVGFAVSGAGGFTLSGTTKNSGVYMPTGAWNVAGPTTLTTSTNTTSIQLNSVQSGGGAFSVSSPVASPGSFTVNGDAVFSSTFSLSTMSMGIISTTVTFTGAITITNATSVAVNATNLTISNAFSITSSTLLDNISGTCYFSAANLTTSSTSTNWTFTNTRVSFSSTSGNTMTIANPLTLASNGGLYWYGGPLVLTSALTSSGASSYNILAATDSNTSYATLTLNNAVTLVNCQLSAYSITVAGGAGKNFAYSLSTPIPNNTLVSGVTMPNSKQNALNYPEICFDVFTLTNSGGTFSISGGGSAIYRTFIRPWDIQVSDKNASATMSLAVSPTLTDVDFWRITPTGAAARPWTGTRLGNVGTLPNITTATPKTVYWVGGAGAWDGAKWATSSGGAGSATNYPLPQDNAVFDSNSGTGNITYPASIRVGNITISSVPAGFTYMYCPAINVINVTPVYVFVSGGIFGPSSAGGGFTLGNDSSLTYNSFTAGGALSCFVIADGSSSDVHTINNCQNITAFKYCNLMFANLGPVTIDGSLPEPIYGMTGFTRDTSSGNFTITATQIGSSNFNYAAYSYAPDSSGFRFGKTSAVVNYGNCSFYSVSFYPSPFGLPTVYTMNTVHFSSNGATNLLGNLNFIGRTPASSLTTSWQFSATNNCSFLSITLSSNTNNTFGQDSLLFYNTGSYSVSTYSMSATYGGTRQSLELTGSLTSTALTKLGGGFVSLTNVNVTSSANAFPSNSWYTTGAVAGGVTGWNTTTPPTAKGGFFIL